MTHPKVLDSATPQRSFSVECILAGTTLRLSREARTEDKKQLRTAIEVKRQKGKGGLRCGGGESGQLPHSFLPSAALSTTL